MDPIMEVTAENGVTLSGFPSGRISTMPSVCFWLMASEAAKLPQISFLWQQKFCRDKHVFVPTKDVFCHDKSMLVATYFCRDKFFISINICRDKQFCPDKTRLLSRQKYACRDNFCHDKKLFVATKIFCATNIILPRQKFCRGKHTFVATKECFVATNTGCENVCRDKNYTCGSSRQ